MTPLKRLGAVVLGLAFMVSGTACSTRAPSDSIVLYYASGAGENKAFGECIEPGQAGSYPVDDEIFYLPTSLRTWNIQPDGGDLKEPIKTASKPVGTQPGPEMEIWATANFYLNTDCTGGKSSPIVQFWEKTGRSKGVAADGEDGFKQDKWVDMLKVTLHPAEGKALRQVSRGYTADELNDNLNDTWAKMERQMAQLFQKELREAVGGDYFCGAGYQRGKDVEWTEWVSDGTDEQGLPKVKEETKRGKCPPVRISIVDINHADKQIAASRANVFKAEQDAKAALIAAQSQVAVAATLSQASKDANYMRLREAEMQLEAAKACAANPNCTLVIGAGGVNVNTK
jgi:hypothetical protein